MSVDDSTIVRSRRLAERRRAVRGERRRRYRRRAIAVLTIVTALVGALAVSRSSLFEISDVAVVGTRRLPRADVLEAAGIAPGNSVIGLDTEGAAERVAALPGVLSARVERSGGLGVVITVTEAAPVVIVRAGERVWALDRNGQVIPVDDPPKHAPVIRLPDPGPLGSVMPAGTVRAVMAIHDALPRALQRKLGRFAVDPDGSVSFKLGKARVIFGTPDRIDEKIAAIELVRDRVRHAGRRLIRLDVRTPRRPAARVR